MVGQIGRVLELIGWFQAVIVVTATTSFNSESPVDRGREYPGRHDPGLTMLQLAISQTARGQLRPGYRNELCPTSSEITLKEKIHVHEEKFDYINTMSFTTLLSAQIAEW